MLTSDIVILDSILEQQALLEPLIILNISPSSAVQEDPSVSNNYVCWTSDLMTSYIEFSPIIAMAILTVQTVRTLPAFVGWRRCYLVKCTLHSVLTYVVEVVEDGEAMF